MNYTIKKYHAGLKADWDDLIKGSSNGTFLHLRDYMDYHANRFEDFSLMIYEGLKLRAVLPAHRVGKDIFAHKGLTYSDFIFDNKLRIEPMLSIMEDAFKYLLQNDITKIHINTIPAVFHKHPSESSLYIYHQIGGNITKVKPFFILNTVDYQLNKDRKKNLKKVQQQAFEIKSDDIYLYDFWQIVSDNLRQKFNTKPVHSYEEISRLQRSFPEQIKLFTIWQDGILKAGTLVYLINNVCHFQYIHASPDGDKAIVDALIYHLIKTYEATYQYISFGSSEASQNALNKNLSYWKESFGCKIRNQIQYEINLESYIRLKDIMQ